MLKICNFDEKFILLMKIDSDKDSFFIRWLEIYYCDEIHNCDKNS